MAVPGKLRIVREEGYHTDAIGRYDGGRQFMAFVTATLPPELASDWEPHKRWYAVLHTFDEEGHHLGTQAEFMGTTADGEAGVLERAGKKLADLIAGLGSVEYGDVEVELFEEHVDGFVFGLVDASEPTEEYESIHLLPNDLAFFEPWDGTYDT